MIDVKQILYEITGDENVFEENINLIDSGIMDSFVFIELFAKLEDYDILLQPTRLDRTKLQTVKGIESLIEEYFNQN